MKFFLLISLMAVSICSAEFNKNQMGAIMKVTKQCYKQLDIPFESDLVDRVIYNKDFKDDITTKKFMDCLIDGFNVWESDDTINRDVVVNFFQEQYDAEQVRATVNKCFQPEGANRPDKAYNYFRCFFKNKTFEF